MPPPPANQCEHGITSPIRWSSWRKLLRIGPRLRAADGEHCRASAVRLRDSTATGRGGWSEFGMSIGCLTQPGGRGAESSLEVGRDRLTSGVFTTVQSTFRARVMLYERRRCYTRRMGCSRKPFLPFRAAQASRASSSRASNLSTPGSCGRLSSCRRSPVSAPCGAGRGRGR